MSSSPFARRTIVALVLLCGLSFIGALVLGAVGPRELTSSRADAFSTSALGHRALAEFLERMGVPVVVSRYDSGHRSTNSAVLVLAEPRIEGDLTAASRLREMAQGERVLLVLPKRQGQPDPQNNEWVANTSVLPEPAVDRVLETVGLTVRVVRPGELGSCNAPGLGPSIALPQLLAVTENAALRPIVQCDRGVLVGELDTPRGKLLVLSDPDVIANHGLAKGDNALLAWSVLQRLRGPDAAVVLDEVLHGHQATPSLVAELFQLPLLPLSLQVLATLLLLIAAGIVRFGAPTPDLSRDVKQGLVETAGSLLIVGGHTEYVLWAYYRDTVQEVARHLHAPLAAEPQALADWLDEVGRRRRTSLPRVLVDKAFRRHKDGALGADPEQVREAQRIYKWKREMLHAASRRSAD